MLEVKKFDLSSQLNSTIIHSFESVTSSDRIDLDDDNELFDQIFERACAQKEKKSIKSQLHS